MRVAIIGSSVSRFRKGDDTIYDLAAESARELLKRHNIRQKEIESVLVSTSSNEQYTASIVSEMLGIKPKVAHRIEHMCSSGLNALVSAYSYIASGLCNTALVIGVEKAESPAARLEWDLTRGPFKHPAHWASIFARAHMRAYNTTEEQMAMVSVKNHANAMLNPSAYFRKKLSIDDVLNSREIVKPVKLYECSIPCDGSASILLASEEYASQFDNPVWIRGIGQRSVAASFSSIKDLTRMESTILASRDAYSMASIKPEMVDVAEVHDAFTICEILAYEDLGFIEKGAGGKFIEMPSVVVNPRGGLIGAGHPIGATGVAQAAEIFLQLRGEAGKRQVKDSKIGLVQNLAAAGTSASVMIMGVE